MNKRIKLLALTGALVTGSVFATEYRTPYLSERGPLRCDFFRLKKDDDCKWSFNAWKTMHMKHAHRAFQKHSFDSKPLTSVIFNKSDFRFRDIFPGSDIDYLSENYDVFYKILKYSPRASYSECGMTMGGSFDWDVWEGKGRVGIRASLPLRRIEMHRDDDTDLLQAPLEQVTDSDVMQVNVTSGGAKGIGIAQAISDLTQDANFVGIAPTANDAAVSAAVQAAYDAVAKNQTSQAVLDVMGDFAGSFVLTIQQSANKKQAAVALANEWLRQAESNEGENVVTKAYRFDFVRNMLDVNRESIVKGDKNTLNIFNQNIAGAEHGFNPHESVAGLVATGEISGDPLMHAYMWRKGAAAQNDGQAFDRADSIVTNDALKSLGADGAVSSDAVYYFDSSKDYTDLIKNLDKKSKTCPCTEGPETNEPWLIFRRQADSSEDDQRFGAGAPGVAGVGGGVARHIETYTAIYEDADHPLLKLAKAGIEFETDRRTGLGDLDVDIFYNHRFTDEVMAEFFFGVRFPTASSHDNVKTGNPYRAHLGNGGHFELKLGGYVAWQPLNWMNLKADLAYSFVLQAEERRMAVYKGACVKNVGPCAKADVDWGYFTGRLDLNFFHPDCLELAGTLGYEFYYKTKDKVCFKQATMESLGGKKWDIKRNAGGAVTDRNLVDNPQALSGDDAAKNTESLSHKVRGEASYRVNDYLDVFCGGSFTFAGQNAFKDCDAHAGFNVRF